MVSDRQVKTYLTGGNIAITRTARLESQPDATDALAAKLDERLGVLLTSSFEYPGRYTHRDIGFSDPALCLTGRQRGFEIRACNDRGTVLIPAVTAALRACDAIESFEADEDTVMGRVRFSEELLPEEMRGKHPTIFSVVRAIINLFRSPEDDHLGLYGALGYELAFQFDPIRLSMPRDESERNLVLFLPDNLLVVDHQGGRGTRYRYEFEVNGKRTDGLERSGKRTPYMAASTRVRECDHAPGEYAATVRDATEAFRRSDLFGVTPSQTFFEPCATPPSELYRRLRKRNPAPYGALMHLGEKEYLVAASPEMYMRAKGQRIESCPIAGTVARGNDATEDARQIQALLNSEKAESELTMCTDVDRADKYRVCEAESVRVIGHRQIEMYSRVIHTVEHVEGRLRKGYDALDGFLSHTWAVTVTGSPKRHAIQFIEDHERLPRRWYGGAIGFFGFDGSIDTGLTLRTVQIKGGVAEVRAGAALVYGSDPDEEEAETRLKASALLDAIRLGDDTSSPRIETTTDQPGVGKRVIVVDHEDSFVHALAGYFRRTGAEVKTYRSDFLRQRISDENPDLVVLSPGPGRPGDFGMSETIDAAIRAGIPLFGVCLGLQGIVEFYGGGLSVLPTPTHGESSMVKVQGGRLFEGLSEEFRAGRYDLLYADIGTFPDALTITAESDEGIVMAVEHPDLPISAVQFHPHSIMTPDNDVGMAVVKNVMRGLDSTRTALDSNNLH